MSLPGPVAAAPLGVVEVLPPALVRAADELRPGLEPIDVSPGLLGFLVVFAMVLACIPLFRSLTGKLRGVEHRAAEGDEPPTDPDQDAPTSPDDAPPPSRG